MKRGSGVGRAAAFVAAAALLSAFAGAVATSASPSAGKRGSVVYRLALTGALHIHAEEVGKCSGGGTISSVEDSVLQVSTPRAQTAWVVADNHTAPPPGFLPASPGIYGFGHNGWLRFGVVTQMQGHYEDCEKAPTSTHCSRAGTVDGRFESSRHPRTMYFSLLHLQPRGCYSQFQDDFVADLHGRAALARVPLGAIVHRVPSTFGLHQRQRGRFDTWTVTSDLDWDAHIAPADELVAVALARPAQRGDRVKLDGSKSYKNVKSYRWKLARGAGCPSEVKFAPETLEGKTVSFRALCPFKATLTVSDGKQTDSDTIAVRVDPRPWKTPFSRAPDSQLNSKLVDGFLQLGRNVCAYEGLTGSQTSGHILHRSGANGEHDLQGGFTVAEITTGPFKGNFYVAVYRTKIRRAALISADLFEGSDLYSANSDANRLDDLLALRNSVREHEELHSTLIERELAKADRAKKIEAMFDNDGAALADRVNVALVQLETELTDATSDAKVKANMPAKWNRPATVLVRDGGGGFVERTFPSLAQLGDDGP